MTLLGAAWIPMWYFLNLYLQQVLGYGAFASGAALLPMTVLLMIFMTAITARLLAKFGARPLIAGGLFVLAAGLVWLSAVEPTGTFLVDVLPASLVAALGMSLAYIPAMMAALSGAPQEQAGLASGIVNTTYNVGSALGLAALTALAMSQGAGELGNLPALTDGFSAAFVAAAAIAAIGGLITLFVMRSDKQAAAAAQAAPAAHGDQVGV
jgi:MFS family permease